MMKRLGLAVTQAVVLVGLCFFLAFQRLPYSFVSDSISSVQSVVLNHHNGSSESDGLSSDSVAVQSITQTVDALISSPTEAVIWNSSPNSPSATEISTTATPSKTIDPSVAITEIKKEDNGSIPDPSLYIQAIMSPENANFQRLSCPAPKDDRYDYLRYSSTSKDTLPQYFFALDLHQCAALLPRLLGSVVETIRFLGPENCVLSIVEGRSTDGTFEILDNLRQEIEKTGAQYFFAKNDVNPLAGEGVDRIQALADLRNQALTPLLEYPEKYDPDTTIVFINDIALCMEDILELVHQRVFQNADMTCAMDWIYSGAAFYDVWVSRGMNGDQFFEIPQSGSWDYSGNLFWNDGETRNRFDNHHPFQAFSCWNGATAFTAKPLMEHTIKFRTARPNECYLGEPTHFCKDMWQLGYGRIAVIPSVNVGYSDEDSTGVKERQGTVSKWAEKEEAEKTLIAWKEEPPQQIKCVPTYEHPSWVAWDQ